MASVDEMMKAVPGGGRMKLIFSILAMMTFLFFLSLSVNMTQDESLRLNRPEMDSLLALFDQTSVRGTEIEGIAGLSQKLKEGAKQLDNYSDSSRTIVLRVSPREARICLEMINRATFQASHAETMKRIKSKLMHYASSV
jgi:hypothetical protein